ncbi:transketolase [Xanthobacter versatilis]|uniref:transketolase n=1 Tax=Xanthobacter autotrophicus (strain ATCC BAA-1158 / Py2) TaxID=78245 RepID=UPI003727B0F5
MPSPNETPSFSHLRDKALQLRRNMLIQAAGKGQGYLGQGFGLAEFFAALYFHELNFDPKYPQAPDRDRFYMSTGHYSIALWAVFAEIGLIPKDTLTTYGADESPLEMSTIEGHVPGVEMTGGSLGHGLGIAAGAALGLRIQHNPARVFVEISDGELQEGSTWEAATAASAFRLDNLVCFNDCNGIQADGALVVPMEPVADKWRAFGWDVQEVDGNALEELIGAMHWARACRGKPKVIVMRTRPGRGIARLEAREQAHFIRVEGNEWDTLGRELELENA